jgi:hypothetical protein
MKVPAFRVNAIKTLIGVGNLSTKQATECETWMFAQARSCDLYGQLLNDVIAEVGRIYKTNGAELLQTLPVQTLVDQATRCPYPRPTFAPALRKAGPNDIPCPKCGCKMATWEKTLRGDEICAPQFVCSNAQCNPVH